MAVAAIALSGCKEKKSAEVVNPAVSVKVATASGEIIAQDVEFTATIEPWQKNHIVPALQGARINRIFVKVGDRVHKGQLVAQMDPTQYNMARVQFETAEADFNRIKQVYEAGGVSQQVFKQTEAAYLIAKETVDNLASNVRLYSPIEGVVTQKFEEEGNLFTQTPILEIMQMDRLKVHVAVSEQYYAAVQVGTPVSVSVDILPGETFEGKVSLIYPAVDAATRTFTVEVTIPNASGRLRPGMFARSVINMGDKPGVLVPDIAVQKQSGSSERYVYVIEDTVARRRVVVPGRQIGGMIDVSDGVSAGEQVATTSFTRLIDGATIEVTN
jgi:RND family efflux transporter MFP subunit